MFLQKALYLLWLLGNIGVWEWTFCDIRRLLYKLCWFTHRHWCNVESIQPFLLLRVPHSCQSYEACHMLWCFLKYFVIPWNNNSLCYDIPFTTHIIFLLVNYLIKCHNIAYDTNALKYNHKLCLKFSPHTIIQQILNCHYQLTPNFYYITNQSKLHQYPNRSTNGFMLWIPFIYLYTVPVPEIFSLQRMTKIDEPLFISVPACSNTLVVLSPLSFMYSSTISSRFTGNCPEHTISTILTGFDNIVRIMSEEFVRRKCIRVKSRILLQYHLGDGRMHERGADWGGKTIKSRKRVFGYGEDT